MAGISLREYIREIEKQVDGKRYEEAIAHCHHILISYPKHVDVYRLLGKAFLESQRYGDAADIFQRVLSAIPDDFVSHAGMSIIREDEGNLDEAIWHMERAFDVQPSNSAIQEELRRMYGRRDNVEPPKIRLSRSALARMYYRGELYPQAIAETRAALAENPDRLDLQALLAEIYSKAGQRAEAVEIANQILRRLPYCLVANRVLFEALSTTDQASEAATYHQRLCQLNPYYSFVSDSSSAVENVPDSAIRLDKLEWKVGQSPTGKAGQPIWAASLGVDLGDTGGTKEEPLPEWLSSSESSQSGFEPGEIASVPAFSMEESAAVISEPDLEIAVPAEEDQLPDWMKDLGWTPASDVSRAAEPELTFADETEAPPVEGELAEAELPEWFKEIAPPSVEQPLADEQAPLIEESVAEDENLAPWLDKLFASNAAPEEAPTSVAEVEEEKLLEATAADEVAATFDETVLPTEAPEFVLKTPEKPSEVSAPLDEAIEEELPEWLFTAEETAPQPQAEPSAPAEELPSWLEEQVTTEETPEAAPPFAEEEMEELPSWLFKSEAEEEPAAQVEQPTTELPEWLLEEEPPAETPAGEELPEWQAASQPLSEKEVVEAETISEALELPDWLKAELGSEEVIESEAQSAAIPDWLLESESDQEEALAEAEETIEEEAGDWLAEIEATAQDIMLQSGEGEEAVETPQWLLEKEEPLSQEVPATEIPDWLKAVESSTPAADLSSEWLSEQPAPETEEAELEQAELPDWLLEIQPAEALLDQQVLIEPGEEVESRVALEMEQQSIAETSPVVEIGDTQPTPAPPEAALEEPTAVDKEMEEALAWLNLMLSPQGPPPATTTEEAKPVSPAEQPPSSGILDDEAAFAWLESLAVRQGAQEALLLSPEERQETPPEWVLQDVERGAAEAPVAALEEPLALKPEEAEQEEEQEAVEAETAQPAAALSDEDAAFAWLESLAVRQGAQEALLLSPEERLEAPPDWVLEQEAPQPEAAPGSTETVSEEAAPSLEQIVESKAVAEAEIEGATGEAPAAVSEAPVKETLEAPSALPAEEALPELPTWLIETSVGTHEEQLEWTPPPITRRKYDLNLATLVELERLPGVGFIMAQQIIEYRQQHGPFQQVDDLLKVPNFTSYTLEGIRDYLFVAAAPQPSISPIESKAPDTGPVILAEGAGVPQEILEARELLSRNELELALAAYARLIERGDHLSWVIDDLNQAAAQFPSQISILQNLGDAYLRSNQLSEALRAYTQAERLLA